MIVSLTGRIAEKATGNVVIDVGGIGFEMSMSMSSLAALPAEGDEVTVLTHMHVREEEISLFGFENAQEKALFTRLLTVSGVGPKVALAALSSFTPAALISAIVTEDDTLVATVPGIGKKTAQRIILELKDALGGPEGNAGVSRKSGGAPAALAEARDALMTMGFSSTEAAAALKGAEPSLDDAGALVRYALGRLGGGSR